MGWLQDETGLGRNAANFVPLTPLSFLNRAADVFADREAMVYGDRRWTYAQYRDRVTRLAAATGSDGVVIPAAGTPPRFFRVELGP